jgi:hypothetical protein
MEIEGGESASGYHFIFMCDRSGSMGVETRTVVTCVENFLIDRKKEAVPVTYSLIAFDDQIDLFASNNDINEPIPIGF